ncbi:hypothetical protein, partial [Pseudomonas amygdali]|uniref:hypothetical protein n=1 Tax=Pseudomonas amygdali TaxID=47877 RepID=UPI000AA73855
FFNRIGQERTVVVRYKVIFKQCRSRNLPVLALNPRRRMCIVQVSWSNDYNPALSKQHVTNQAAMFAKGHMKIAEHPQ